jgi:hypothetical protein
MILEQCLTISQNVSDLRDETDKGILFIKHEIHEFNLKVEVTAKKFKRLTCDWLATQASLAKQMEDLKAFESKLHENVGSQN